MLPDRVEMWRGCCFNTSLISQNIAESSTSGDVLINSSVDNMGNNSNQFVAPLQFANTGSNQNVQGVLFGSNAGDIELTGGEFTFVPVLNTTGVQVVWQSFW